MSRSDGRFEPSSFEPSYDVIVLGGGCAGLSTALFAALRGLRPIVLESTAFVGGTTALSAGAIWIPGTDEGRAVNPDDDLDAAAAYLRRVSGNAADAAMQQRFLQLGPVAVRALADNTQVELRAFPHHPDYFSDLEGATACGRVLQAPPFDGRVLRGALNLIRPPIREFTLLGGMMVDRTDIAHLLNATHSWGSFRYSAGLVRRHLVRKLSGRRSPRLVMGAALVGRLLASLIERKVPVITNVETLALDQRDGRVTGIRALREKEEFSLKARGGVVLAGGGFNRNASLRARLIPEAPAFSPIAPGATGRTIELALALDARLGAEKNGNAFWAPVSVAKRRDATRAVFPHFVLDRAKPGTVVVNQSGRRFLNESASYNVFARAMIEANRTQRCIPAYLIADHRALIKFGLGLVRPGGWGRRRLRRIGYLHVGRTIDELARSLKLPADHLMHTIERMNGFAATGVDLDFHRGETLYERNLGDPAVGPNPTLGKIETAPFYTVELFPSDIAASAGLVTDGDARVLKGDGPIPGLYAVGNDMDSVMGGAYPGPGITLGPAIAFAYAAAQTIADDLETAGR
jgi:succinate dehydrogenase/fumarate reductase flavoprotein subunit